MTKHIPIKLVARVFKDRHGIWIAYNEKYDISGYGNTKQKAEKMFQFMVLEILAFTKPKNYYKRLNRKTGKLKLVDK